MFMTTTNNYFNFNDIINEETESDNSSIFFCDNSMNQKRPIILPTL